EVSAGSLRKRSLIVWAAMAAAFGLVKLGRAIFRLPSAFSENSSGCVLIKSGGMRPRVLLSPGMARKFAVGFILLRIFQRASGWRFAAGMCPHQLRILKAGLRR